MTFDIKSEYSILDKSGKTRVYYTITCDICGKDYSVEKYNLKKKKSYTCMSCSIRSSNTKRRIHFNHEAALNLLCCKYRSRTPAKVFGFDLTMEEFESITSSNCHYCNRPPQNIIKAKSGGEYTYNGIDRVDSYCGYTKGNVVPCCEHCNRAKGLLSYADFITYLNNLVTFRQTL